MVKASHAPVDAVPALVSMTGFAARRGAGEGFDWTWDVRSVNGKGFDLRLRVPDWIDGLEAGIRAAVARRAQRGNISLGLKLSRAEGVSALRVNPDALASALYALQTVEVAARSHGVGLASPSAADVLALRGILETGSETEDTAPLLTTLLADLEPLLDDFEAMRAAEGRALSGVIGGQVDRIAALAAEAAVAAEARRPSVRILLLESLARVMEGAPGADEPRVAQELALLAVKSDVTEELDRLSAHVGAARALMHEGGPVGRKFDFLMQEFMREANTLCSKSGDRDLTRIGLDLKTVIDQMREQVQNVE